MTQINGQSFPDHVLALTWDDGPDAISLPLARYLHHEKVSATFFVVASWVAGLSSDPGEGRGVYESGYEHRPTLDEVIGLGHRLGNHTLNHRLLTDLDPAQVDFQVRANQERLDPLLSNELRLLRVPGGAWNLAAAAAVEADPYLARLTGPIRWDVDRKDWEGSLYCQSSQPALECEHAAVTGGRRTRSGVVAKRYLASIEEAKRGIVLFHDRVGDVGSSYPLEIARALVPALEARGYVFAAPVLAFSPLLARTPPDWEPPSPEDAIAFLDIDGDGRADLCAQRARGIECLRSVEVAGTPSDPLPRARFRDPIAWPRSDRTFLRAIASPAAGTTALPGVQSGTLRAGDLNGDGRPDLCGQSAEGVVCALALPAGAGFTGATTWLRDGMTDTDANSRADASTPRPRLASIQLADVNGDGRADLCAETAQGVACGLAP